jgi:hypothetical protein
MPFYKVPMKGRIRVNMLCGNLLITSAQPFKRVYIWQLIPFFVVTFATCEDKVPSPIFQNE